MIQFRNLALTRGSQRLFFGASASLEHGWKLGLVGANGSGKSSLLALLAGELAPEAGACEVQPGTQLARIEQEAPELEREVIEYLLDADRRLRAAQADIAQAEMCGANEELALAHERFALADGYSAPARARALLAGLGFADGDSEREVRELSGGFRMRLNLARALMQPSDLLLLDEPTNHLDLDAILWLEGWLRSYPGTLLVVSHDRAFLDRIADHTLALTDGRLRLYTGNYSKYEYLRAAELAQHNALAVRQAKELQRINTFVERFRAKASKARQAQSRLKSLERMARTAPVYAASAFRFRFEEPARRLEHLLALETVSVGYGERSVLAGISISIRGADRLAIIGPNGAGKTTLVRLLAGDLAPLGGRRIAARDLVVGYFAQHQVEMLRAEETPLSMMVRLFHAEREQLLRDFLGRFGFASERAECPIGPLSGGEKARLALAALVKRRPNLLLLDEPTNHLDLEMRRALALALQDFSGALVVVSHDRDLVASCADRILVVNGGRASEFDGDLEDYRRLKMEEARAKRPFPERRSRRDERRADAEARAALHRRLKPLQKELDMIEERVAALGREMKAVLASLSDPALYEDAQAAQLKEALVAEARVRAALAAAEEDWLHAAARVEALRAQTELDHGA